MSEENLFEKFTEPLGEMSANFVDNVECMKGSKVGRLNEAQLLISCKDQK